MQKHGGTKAYATHAEGAECKKWKLGRPRSLFSIYFLSYLHLICNVFNALFLTFPQRSCRSVKMTAIHITFTERVSSSGSTVLKKKGKKKLFQNRFPFTISCGLSYIPVQTGIAPGTPSSRLVGVEKASASPWPTEPEHFKHGRKPRQFLSMRLFSQ